MVGKWRSVCFPIRISRFSRRMPKIAIATPNSSTDGTMMNARTPTYGLGSLASISLIARKPMMMKQSVAIDTPSSVIGLVNDGGSLERMGTTRCWGRAITDLVIGNIAYVVSVAQAETSPLWGWG